MASYLPVFHAVIYCGICGHFPVGYYIRNSWQIPTDEYTHRHTFETFQVYILFIVFLVDAIHGHMCC